MAAALVAAIVAAAGFGMMDFGAFGRCQRKMPTNTQDINTLKMANPWWR
jgi:hypothetical protein